MTKIKGNNVLITGGASGIGHRAHNGSHCIGERRKEPYNLGYQ